MARLIFRTGRTSLTRMHATYGPQPVRGPVIDVGAGDSTLAADLSEHDVFAVAVDPDYANTPPRAGAAVAALVEALPFRSNSFAEAHASYVLMHLRRPETALEEMTRVTRVGGRLCIKPVWLARHDLFAGLSAGWLRVDRGSLVPRRRPAIEVTVLHPDIRPRGWDQLAHVVSPHRLIRSIASLGMSAVIRFRGTNRLDTTRLDASGTLRRPRRRALR